MATVFNFLKKRLIFLASAALILGWLGILLGEYFWFLELFSHFVPHYCVLFVLAIFFAAKKGRYFWAVWAVLSGIWLFVPFQAAPTSSLPVFHAIWYNVNLHNPQPEHETTVLIQENADLLALAEINVDTVRWHGLRQHYPHGCHHRSDSPFALAVISRQAMASCTVHFVAHYPYIRSEIQGVAVYALHPPPPINAELAADRKHYLQHIASKIALENNVLVLGDLNSSPYSPIFRQFRSDAQIQTQTPHYLPTWRPLGLNIDHVLTRQNQGHGVKIRALDWAYSDHRAISVLWY